MHTLKRHLIQSRICQHTNFCRMVPHQEIATNCIIKAHTQKYRMLLENARSVGSRNSKPSVFDQKSILKLKRELEVSFLEQVKQRLLVRKQLWKSVVRKTHVQLTSHLQMHHRSLLPRENLKQHTFFYMFVNHLEGSARPSGIIGVLQEASRVCRVQTAFLPLISSDRWRRITKSATQCHRHPPISKNLQSIAL